MKAKRILFQSRLFTVPKRDSTEERLILDLSCLNGYIHCPTFKMLTLKDISAILPPGYWTVSLDLKDGFWHVNIFHKLRPYLGFRYRGQLYQFRAMPFGLNLAPLTFTKLIAHMVKVLAEEGIWCLPFLDDLLILAPSKEECLAHLQRAIQILEDFGWVINEKKSRKQPQKIFTWLGMEYDLVVHTRSATVESRQSLQNLLRSLLTSQNCTKRHIMRLQGTANWVGTSNPISRLLLSKTKMILKFFRHRKIDQKIILKKWMKLSLIRWLHIPHVPQTLGNPSPDIVIQTDASLKGWGFKAGKENYRGIYDESMTKYSINILELMTVWLALLTLNKKYITIQILTDSSTAVSAIRKCSSTYYHIAMLAELVWRRAIHMEWNIQIAHIKGSFNVIADKLSRNTVISTEWSFSQEDFRLIQALNARLQVDLFATSLNNKLRTFISPCPDQLAAGVDAMITPWEQWEHLYLYPPTNLLSKVLAKLSVTSFQSAILVTPRYRIKP